MAPTAHTVQIDVVANIPVVSPHILQVHAGDRIKWVIGDGTARITFLDPNTVGFDNGIDITTPEQPAQGMAQVEGVHEYSITVWVGEYKSGAATQVLIIDPRPDGDSNA